MTRDLVAGQVLPSVGDAVREIHFPSTDEALARARETLVLAEFFAMQMLLASRRARSRARTGRVHCGPGELLERFLRALPFDLTNAQARVIEELRRDLGSTFPMNRLLQGDVGSGKTVVAIAAMLLAVEAGYQAALMAPTQILAEQHYAVLRRWLEPLGVPYPSAPAREKRTRCRSFANAHASDPGSTGGPPVASGGSPGRIRATNPLWRKAVASRTSKRPWAIVRGHVRDAEEAELLAPVGTRQHFRLHPALEETALRTLRGLRDAGPCRISLLEPWPSRKPDRKTEAIFYSLTRDCCTQSNLSPRMQINRAREKHRGLSGKRESI